MIQYNIIQHCPTSYETVSNDMIELWDRDKERLAWYVECSEITLELIVLVINQVSLVMYKRSKLQTKFKFIYLAQPYENCLYK